MQTVGSVYLYFALQATLDRLEAERSYDGGDILFGAKTKASEDGDARRRKKRAALFAMPSPSELLRFMQFAGPMFLISLARGVSWNITTPAAAAAGTLALAAHQVLLNVFFFFTIAGEAVFQTVQAYMPEFQQQQVAAKERVKLSGDRTCEVLKEANARVQKLAKKIIVIALLCGVVQVLVSMVPPKPYTRNDA